MISAEKARELSLGKVEVYLEFIEKKISEAANNGLLEIIIREEPFAYWLYSDKYQTHESVKILKLLKDSGYTYTMYYKESQFVDMGLRISWKN